MANDNLNGTTEAMLIDNKMVTYTFGEDFVLVDDGYKITKITQDKDGNIYVDGKEIKQIDSFANIQSRQMQINALQEDWQLIATTTGNVDLGLLAINVAIGVIALKCGLSPTKVKDVVLAELTRGLINGILPSIYYVSWKKSTYYKNLNQPRPDMKIVTKFYKGSNFNTYIGTSTIYGM